MGTASSRDQLMISERANTVYTDSGKSCPGSSQHSHRIINPPAMIVTTTMDSTKSPLMKFLKNNNNTNNSSNNITKSKINKKGAIRRQSSADKTVTVTPSLELLGDAADSGNSSSEEQRQPTNVVFRGRMSLSDALDQLDSCSNHSTNSSSSDIYKHGFKSSADKSMYCIVRSDKLAFNGTGIRRHSRRKRQRLSGRDNTPVVILRTTQSAPSMRQSALLATRQLETECAKNMRFERRLSRGQLTSRGISVR